MSKRSGLAARLAKLTSLKIVEELPAIFASGKGDRFPDDLVGSSIVAIGTFEDDRLVETGGLVIDYKPAGADQVKRLVLAFNDIGMWIEDGFPLARDAG